MYKGLTGNREALKLWRKPVITKNDRLLCLY